MKLYVVDAFTSRRFGGNQAAVCLVDQTVSDSWMQAFAREMNYSETAYVRPQGDSWELRWFTPAYEVDLCGHATLATAHVLWSEQGVTDDSIRFQTRSGELVATKSQSGIQLDFPATPATGAEIPKGLVEALRVEPKFVGMSKFDALVEVADEATLRTLEPDFVALREIEVRGVIATAASTGEPHDFVSRFFAPGAGIDEDPVTGSAHCCLTPFWAPRLGKQTMNAFQASERGGELSVTLSGERVLLTGQAVTVVRGELTSEALSQVAEPEAVG